MISSIRPVTWHAVAVPSIAAGRLGLRRFFVETLGSEIGPGYSFSEPNRFRSGSELKNMRRESLIVPCGYLSGHELVDWIELY